MTIAELLKILEGYSADDTVLVLAPDGAHRDILYVDDGESMCEPVVLLVAQ